MAEINGGAATSARTAFVTGAAGVMGVRLVRGLVEAGWRVRALVLPGDALRARLAGLGCDIREGDVADAATLRGACAGVDTVYHLAAVILSHDPSVFARVNREGTAHVVAEAARAGVRHFIYVSSASVTYPKRTPYADSKLAAEELVKAERSFAHTIVRPTLVYDVGGGQELLLFLDYLRRFPVVPFIGAGRALKRPVWAGDVIDGLLRLAGKHVAHGKTYNFSGGEAIAIADFGRLLLRHHGERRLFLPVPVPICRALAFVLGRLMKRPPLTASAIAGIVNEADLDPALAMRELGYRAMPVREGLSLCFPVKSSPTLRERSALVSKPEGNSP
ncbi:MAG TPA: NAD-dependent epimerase/dehydratase family protein [Polyangia bacterium]|nr:NAD-dependent epimerase/dehydratase family protein [Polyangia bacterium]